MMSHIYNILEQYRSKIKSSKGTLWRRLQLKESKYFECTCKRCSDKTELKTWMSAIKCGKCITGYLLPINPLDDLSNWRCDKCQDSKQRDDIYQFVERLLEETEELTYKTIDEMESFIKKHESYLHPNHFSLLSVKLKLSQLYGKTYNCMIGNMSEVQLQRKIDICKEIIKIFNVIEPGLSRIRGITLYELHAPVLISGTTALRKSNNIKKFKQTIKEVKNYLHEANTILSFEDPTSKEGQIGKAAAEALHQMEG